MSKILIVDDEDIVRSTLKRILNRDDMETTTAPCAKDALAILENEQFDLIITDVKMPEMDGITFLKKVKQDPKTELTPVIVLTGFATVEMTREALQNGAFNFLTKPFEVETILNIVKRGLNLKNEIVINKEVNNFTKCSFDIVIPSRSELLGGVMYYIMEQMKLIGFSERVVTTDVLMTLDEAITNAHKHGNKKDTEKKIYVTTTLDGEKMTMVIRDEGEGFKQEELINPLSPEGIERNCGRGVFLIKGYMDEVSYNEKGNELTIVKYNRR